MIFRETVRDVDTEEPNYYVMDEEDQWRAVGLHEVAHQFGLDHDLTEDGPIMDPDTYDSEEVEELIFSPDGLRQITWRNFPREWTPGNQ